MDQNLRETAAYFSNASELQAAIDATRLRTPTLETQQQREAASESIDNYLRIAQCNGWDCK
jgi:hypothetical protein